VVNDAIDAGFRAVKSCVRYTKRRMAAFENLVSEKRVFEDNLGSRSTRRKYSWKHLFSLLGCLFFLSWLYSPFIRNKIIEKEIIVAGCEYEYGTMLECQTQCEICGGTCNYTKEHVKLNVVTGCDFEYEKMEDCKKQCGDYGGTCTPAKRRVTIKYTVAGCDTEYDTMLDCRNQCENYGGLCIPTKKRAKMQCAIAGCEKEYNTMDECQTLCGDGSCNPTTRRAKVRPAANPTPAPETKSPPPPPPRTCASNEYLWHKAQDRIYSDDELVRITIVIPTYGRADDVFKLVLTLMQKSLLVQGVRADIFIAEQVHLWKDIGMKSVKDPWNKGRLYNAAVSEIMSMDKENDRSFSNLVLHDADIWECCPNTLNYRMCASNNNNRIQQVYAEQYDSLNLGGIFCTSIETYAKFDGFANRFEGWGYEDVDLARRVINAGVEVTDANLVNRAKTHLLADRKGEAYTACVHDDWHGIKPEVNEVWTGRTYEFDPDDPGLASVRYNLVSKKLMRGSYDDRKQNSVTVLQFEFTPSKL